MGDVSGNKRDAQACEGEAACKQASPTHQAHKRARGMRSTQEDDYSRRYLLFIEYNGNDFSGSQRQKKGIRTVQDACEQALESMTKQVCTRPPNASKSLHISTSSSYCQLCSLRVHVDGVMGPLCRCCVRTTPVRY
jgi:hypothetical protein